MSSIEFAGSILGLLSVSSAIFRSSINFIDYFTQIFDPFGPSWEKIRAQRLRKDYGPFWAWVLRLRFGKALAVMERVEIHVLPADGASDAVALKEAFSSSLNMLAVAGAIVAQVAITALSLPDLKQTQGVPQVFFISSLILGVLCVFFSCLVQQIINSLHSSDEIKDWLCKPSSAEQKHLFRHNKDIERILYPADPEHVSNDLYAELKRELDKRISLHRWKLASFSSAMILVAPAELLDLSLNAFIIGLGTYLGWIYKAGLPNLIPNSRGALAVFILYFITLVYGIALFYVPSALKDLESIPTRKFARLMHELRLLRNAIPGSSVEPDPSASIQITQPLPEARVHDQTSSWAPGGPTERPVITPARPPPPPPPPSMDPLLLSLEALVHAQELSLQASQALLNDYRRTKAL